MCWQWLDQQTLKLSFPLPKGSFATNVIRELINQYTENIIDIEEWYSFENIMLKMINIIIFI